MNRYGYARVSTPDQSLDMQFDALRADGCKKIFSDHASGAKSDRPGLRQVLEVVAAGDLLVVWKLDRLARSVHDLVETARLLETRGAGLKTLTEGIDTSSAGGRLTFHVLAAVAELERELAAERTLAGLAAARARGRKGGRPRVMDEATIALAQSLLRNGHSIPEVCATLGISRSSLYAYLTPSGDLRRHVEPPDGVRGG